MILADNLESRVNSGASEFATSDTILKFLNRGRQMQLSADFLAANETNCVN